MTENEKINAIRSIKIKGAAIADYHVRGLDFVKRNYPDQLKFVIDNKGRDYKSVREELDNELAIIDPR